MAPIDTSKLTKLYYSISEVAEMLDVSASLIRYWESEFPVLKPLKNSKGERRYNKQNIEKLYQIYYLVKEKGYTLEGAKKELRETKYRSKKMEEIIERLTKVKTGLQHLYNRLS